LGEPQSSPSLAALTPQEQTPPRQQSESQVEKFRRLYNEYEKNLIAGSDGRVTIENIEAVLQPQLITGIDEITEAMLSEPGRPYYFKVRALYKGYDENVGCALLQDLGETQSSVMGAVFGVDTNTYFRDVMNAAVPTLPTEANAIATFYLVAYRLTENTAEYGKLGVSIRFAHNIEKPPFDPAKFIVANGLHYITLADAHVQTEEDAMRALILGGTGMRTSSVFDPVAYPLADLMDARVAMNEKDRFNNLTFPTVRIKYVSELVFKGQSNTTITVSTDDNILTERMTFTGRASAVKAGEKVRVYFTIAKDPLEIWEIQAIERL
jgi:hypothetical protein